MRSLEEQIEDRISELMDKLLSSRSSLANNENDKEIINQIYELKRIMDFRIQPPEE